MGLKVDCFAAASTLAAALLLFCCCFAAALLLFCCCFAASFLAVAAVALLLSFYRMVHNRFCRSAASIGLHGTLKTVFCKRANL